MTEVGPGLDRPNGVDEIDAAGRWVIPGLWDQHVHMAQWTLTLRTARPGAGEVARAGAARWSPSGSRTTPTSRSSAGGTARRAGTATSPSPSWTRSRATRAVVLISGDGHHAWLNTIALMHLAMPVRDSVVREAEWFAAYPRLVGLVGTDGTSPGGLPAHPRDRGRARGRGHHRLRVRPRPAGLGGALGLGLRRPPGARGDVRDAPRRRPRARAAHRRHAAGLRRPRHHGRRSRSSATARSTPAPPGAASRTATRTAWSTPRASPTSPAPTCASSSPGRTRVVSRSPPTRSGTRPSPRRWRRTPPRVRAARSSTPRWSTRPTSARWPSSASGPACSPRTCSTTATSPRRSGASAPSAASPSAGCSTPGSSSRSARTRRSHRSTRGWRWRPRCTAAPTSAGRGTASRRSLLREALAASVDDQPTVGVGSRGDLVLLDQDPLLRDRDPQDGAALGQALRGVTVALTVVAGRAVHDSIS